MENNLLKITMVLMCFIVYSQSINSQSSKEMKDLLKEEMDLRRQDKYAKGIGLFRKYLENSPKELSLEAQQYLNDESDNVRKFAYEIISITGYHSKESFYRQSVVSILVKGCMDKAPYLRTHNANSLTNYKTNEFSLVAKNTIKEILHMDKSYADKLYLIAGFLDLKDQKPFLNKLLEQYDPERTSEIRNLRLALARLGDQKQIDFVIDWVRKSGKDLRNDDFLFPFLAYTRQKQTFDYIFEVINGEDKVLAVKIIEVIIPAIKDFPVKLESGQIDYENWDEAWKIAKEWHQKNKDNYIILKDTFGLDRAD